VKTGAATRHRRLARHLAAGRLREAATRADTVGCSPGCAIRRQWAVAGVGRSKVAGARGRAAGDSVRALGLRRAQAVSGRACRWRGLRSPDGPTCPPARQAA